MMRYDVLVTFGRVLMSALRFLALLISTASAHPSAIK